MQDPASELRRITLPRTWVNKGMRKDRGCWKPRPSVLAELLKGSPQVVDVVADLLHFGPDFRL